MSQPPVCVILPVLDEYDAIDACLSSLRRQDYEGKLSVMVADGGSTDGTLARLSEWQGDWSALAVIDNPQHVQSKGLWLAALATDAEILVRADAHTTYASDFVSRSVRALVESDAVAAGGPMTPYSEGRFGTAVAAAMQHPLGVGPARFHAASGREFVDTVYLGTFRRVDFLDAGGMRTLPSHVAEDADLYYRWRRTGHLVLLDPDIRSVYTPRESATGLWRQFYRYGKGKAEMLMINGEFPSPRPLAPLALVLSLIACLAALPVSRWPLLLVAGGWVGTLLIAMRRPATVAAAMIMHTSYGLGLLRGLARRPATVRAAVEENAQPE